LLHPEGATSEAAIDALWPNDSPERGREHFWTAVGNLRSRLRRPGDDSIDVLPRAGDHYRPDPDLLDVDLWRFEAALTDAAKATEPTEAAAALESAISAYAGDFCPTTDGIWIEPVREDLHRRALDACVRLAELRTTSEQPDAAVGALERAIEIDDICEDAYRRLIDLQMRLGHRDGAVRAWRRLQGRLAELDLDPEPATETLVRQALSSQGSVRGAPIDR
jgi:DNA-binding SARP family transcriptional activator